MAAVFQLEQLAKFPVLFQHYKEHIRMEGKISFAAFLKEHYVQDNPSDPDYDYARDRQLPFKTCPHHFFMLMTAAAAPKLVAEEVKVTTDDLLTYTSPPDDSRLFNSFAGNIFQPPRTGS
ncbi:MAG TPA: hypothetical protein VHN59_14805 [Chitinophagaceae bacterium]|nr:hypothetical protein [Chitinophagaceae bacterium]